MTTVIDGADAGGVASVNESVSVTDEIYANSHFNSACKYHDSGEIQKAKQHYLSTIQLYSNHRNVHLNYGVLLKQCHQYNDAIEQFDVHLKIQPNDFRALSNRANCYSSLKQFGQAINDHNASLSILKKSHLLPLFSHTPISVADSSHQTEIAISLCNRASTYMKMESYSNAQADLIKAQQLLIEQNTINHTTHHLIATITFNRALTYAREHHFANALQTFEEAKRNYNLAYKNLNGEIPKQIHDAEIQYCIVWQSKLKHHLSNSNIIDLNELSPDPFRYEITTTPSSNIPRHSSNSSHNAPPKRSSTLTNNFTNVQASLSNPLNNSIDLSKVSSSEPTFVDVSSITNSNDSCSMTNSINLKRQWNIDENDHKSNNLLVSSISNPSFVSSYQSSLSQNLNAPSTTIHSDPIKIDSRSSSQNHVSKLIENFEQRNGDQTPISNVPSTAFNSPNLITEKSAKLHQLTDQINSTRVQGDQENQITSAQSQTSSQKRKHSLTPIKPVSKLF